MIWIDKGIGQLRASSDKLIDNTAYGDRLYSSGYKIIHLIKFDHSKYALNTKWDTTGKQAKILLKHGARGNKMASAMVVTDPPALPRVKSLRLLFSD